jgi:hypothetical protein
MKWELVAAILAAGVIALLLLNPWDNNGIVPTPATAEIQVEDAAASWSPRVQQLGIDGCQLASLVRPRIAFEYATAAMHASGVGCDALKEVADSTLPRIVFEYATTSIYWAPYRTHAISDITANVRPRIMVEYASTSHLNQDLELINGLQEPALTLQPRIVVEQAADGKAQTVEAPEGILHGK